MTRRACMVGYEKFVLLPSTQHSCRSVCKNHRFEHGREQIWSKHSTAKCGMVYNGDIARVTGIAGIDIARVTGIRSRNTYIGRCDVTRTNHLVGRWIQQKIVSIHHPHDKTRYVWTGKRIEMKELSNDGAFVFGWTLCTCVICVCVSSENLIILEWEIVWK